MKIEFVDLKKQYKTISTEINIAIKRILNSQYFILGPELETFEKNLAEYLGCKYTIGVDNGSDALMLTMKVLGIGPGDEVITPVNSFIATTFAISEVGATPVFVDVDPLTHQIDIEQTESKITNKTKAIMPVHLYGSPFEVEKLAILCKERKLHLIEDAAQAIGAEYKGRKLGTFGAMGIFSFYPGKNMGGYGNGGAICTNDESLYERLRKLRNFGQPEKYKHTEIGINSKLDDIQAAILGVKLKHIDNWNSLRNTWAKKYREGLKKLEISKLSFPKLIDGGISNQHLFVIQTSKRDALRNFLLENGISAQIHYPIPIHLQECYANLGYKTGDFPIAEKIANEILSLPIYPELTEQEIIYTTEQIKKFFANNV